MNKKYPNEIILIVNELSTILLKRAKENKILSKDWQDSTNEEKQEYMDFLRQLYFMPQVLTEKGIESLIEGSIELAGKMFSEAVACDLPNNDYWQSYFCKGIYEAISDKTEQSIETFKELKRKNPLFKQQMQNILERSTLTLSEKVKIKINDLIESI